MARRHRYKTKHNLIVANGVINQMNNIPKFTYTIKESLNNVCNNQHTISIGHGVINIPKPKTIIVTASELNNIVKIINNIC